MVALGVVGTLRPVAAMVDLGDPKDVAKGVKLGKDLRHVQKHALERIMATPTGRRWMYDLLATCHLWHNPFQLDALATAFACGEMNVGQKLLMMVETHCPGMYMKMVEEHNARSSSDRSTDDAGTPSDADADYPGVTD
jgi:hypothetical protein